MDYNSYNEKRRVLLDKESELRSQLQAVRSQIYENSKTFADKLNEEYRPYFGKLVTVKGRERWTRSSLSELKGYFRGFGVNNGDVFLRPYAIMFKPKKDGSESKVQFAECDRILFDEVFTIKEG